MPTNGAMETNMNRIASRLRTADITIARSRSQTPYITFRTSHNAWIVKLGEAYQSFPVSRYGGSTEKALTAAKAYRDERLDDDALQAVYNREASNKAREPKPDKRGDRYRPTIVSQFQLWHKPRNQQQQ